MPSMLRVLVVMVHPFSSASSEALLIGSVAGTAAAMRRALGFQEKSRSALLTTNTDEKPMAAAAIMGLSVIPSGESTPMATGMQIAL